VGSFELTYWDNKPTEPFRANLLRVLRQIFATPFMKDGDNFWFFFSGHGIPHNGQDYLMPLDGDPEDIENTGISTNTITNYLRSCGADNAVMILDACRSSGKKSGEGIGRQTEAEARQTGVISFFSCSPDQYSYELEAITQGAFTHALLEGLGIRGRCATVERLNQYLENRVPNLVSQYLGKARQIPYTIAEPLNRSHLILMPQHASLADIATLKNDAYRAERQQDWDLAQRLWIRINAAASGQDMEAIEALQSLGIQRGTVMTPSQPQTPQSSESSKAAPNPTIISEEGTAERSILASQSLTRQQFLKWAIPAGVGVVGVTVVSQFLGHQSPQPSPLPTSDAQSPQPSPSSKANNIPASPQPSQSPAQSIRSVTADYSRLEEFLKAGEWQNADTETKYLLLKMANPEKKYLDSESVKNISCDALSQINRLWVASSSGQFGFSVQMKIYVEECGGRADGLYDKKAWDCFGERVGWARVFFDYSKMIFSTQAPAGHLPVAGLTLGVNFPPGFDGAPIQDSKALLLFIQKLITCSIY
jgi:uncharacterized caspase-like protein